MRSEAEHALLRFEAEHALLLLSKIVFVVEQIAVGCGRWGHAYVPWGASGCSWISNWGPLDLWKAASGVPNRPEASGEQKWRPAQR